MRQALVLLLLPAIAGCGILGAGRIEGGGTAHVVITHEPGCDVFMTRAYQGDFALMRLLDATYRPTPGDLLEGLSGMLGQQTLRYRPAESQDVRRDSDPVDVFIEAVDLEMSEAQQLYRDFCPSAQRAPR
ncbi:hypothetical protein BH23BAC4_BH23BAC4_04480 [soil metagenome]